MGMDQSSRHSRSENNGTDRSSITAGVRYNFRRGLESGSRNRCAGRRSVYTHITGRTSGN